MKRNATRYVGIVVLSCLLSSLAFPMTGARYSAKTPQIGHSDARHTRSGSSSRGDDNAAATKGASYNSAWSGTRKDIEAAVRNAEQNYGFESTKHLGRNATMLVPATFDEMLSELKHSNNAGWKVEPSDGYHAPDAKRGDGIWTANQKSGKGEIVKYTNKSGGEVVYNLKSGQIVADEKLGTKNFEPEYKDGFWEMWRHKGLDVDPHNEDKDDVDRYSKDGDQYKYVGILYERDPNNPDKYYIIDGQTGLPMTPQQVAEMPTTLSDMWKVMGLSCVSNDAEDIVPPKVDSQQHSTSIDTSRLEALFEEGIAFLAGLIANGEHATRYQIDEHNRRVREIVQEFLNIAKQIESLDVSVEEKKSISEKVLAKVDGLKSQFGGLADQAVSMGLVHEATTEQKMAEVKDWQGKLAVEALKE